MVTDSTVVFRFLSWCPSGAGRAGIFDVTSRGQFTEAAPLIQEKAMKLTMAAFWFSPSFDHKVDGHAYHHKAHRKCVVKPSKVHASYYETCTLNTPRAVSCVFSQAGIALRAYRCPCNKYVLSWKAASASFPRPREGDVRHDSTVPNLLG